MAINLEMPKKLQAVIEKGHQGAAEMLRPISRKYDLREHDYPVELDTLATLFEGISEAKTISFAGTRLSAQPIHKYDGVCWRASVWRASVSEASFSSRWA